MNSKYVQTNQLAVCYEEYNIPKLFFAYYIYRTVSKWLLFTLQDAMSYFSTSGVIKCTLLIKKSTTVVWNTIV